MKKINEILETLNSDTATKNNETYVHVNHGFTDLDYKIVNKLFLTFTSIFPAFKQAWPTEIEFENAKREWIKAFNQVGLKDIEEIKKGVDRFRIETTPFVPSPGQFIEMCRRKEKKESYHRDYIPLAAPKRQTTEASKMAIKVMMEKLGKTKKNEE